MDVKHLSEKDLIHYLLTTDFNSVLLSANEYKYLLDRYRLFYKKRMLSHDNMVDTINVLKKKLQEERDNSIKIQQSRTNEYINMREELYKLKSRKLTLMERLTGKIINNNDKR